MKETYTDAMNEYSEAEKPGLWENIKKKLLVYIVTLMRCLKN